MANTARNITTSATTTNVPLLASPPVRPLLPTNSSLEPEVVCEDRSASFIIPNIHYFDTLIDILVSLSTTNPDAHRPSTHLLLHLEA